MSIDDHCPCCGRIVALAAACMDGGPVHFDCWEEHHSDPTGPWPPDHECHVDRRQDAPVPDETLDPFDQANGEHG